MRLVSDSGAGVLYGLPKVHKPSCPVKAIVSDLGTLNINVSIIFPPILERLTVNFFYSTGHSLLC